MLVNYFVPFSDRILYKKFQANSVAFSTASRAINLVMLTEIIAVFLECSELLKSQKEKCISKPTVC